MKIIKRTLLFTAAIVFIFSVLCGCERLYSYDKIKNQMLFDHIVYDGTPYYIAEQQSVDLADNDQVVRIEETVKITIVDENGIPYDAERTEDAWVFVNDPDRIYVYFGSAYYTRDTSLASQHYEFGELKE